MPTQQAKIFNRGLTIDLVAPFGGVSVGGVYLIADLLVIAANTASEGARVAAYTAGVFEVRVKRTGEAWSQGQKVYWDAGAGEFTTTSTANTLAGSAADAAGSSATRGYLLLNAFASQFGSTAGGSSASLIHQASVTLTDAQIKAWPSTPVTLAPSAGATRAMVFSSGYGHLTLPNGTVYTGVTWNDIEGPEIEIGGCHEALTGAGWIFGSAPGPSNVAVFMFASPLTPVVPSAIIGLGNVNRAYSDNFQDIDQIMQVRWYPNAAPDFGGGDPDNTCLVIVEFRVVDFTLGRYLTTDESGWDEATRTFS